MENQKLNLYQKLLEIQKQIVGLGKDGKSYGYQYVTGTKVLEHLKPLMNQYGILLKQEITSIENTRQDYGSKNGPKSEILTKAMMRFTWIDCETGEKDVNEFGANGQNDWEKGLGSSLTYAERYFLLKYFHIATDEDDIDNPERKKEEPAKAAPKQVAAQPKAPEKAPEPMTAAQQEEMLKLINEPVFTQKQRDDLIAKISKYNKDSAATAIEKMKKSVEAAKVPANAA